MTAPTLATPRPILDPDWPTLPPFPPTGPQTWPDGGDGGTGDGGAPPPPPRMSLRIGRAPRRTRRQRLERVFLRAGWYVVGFGLVVFASYWPDDVHLFVPGLVFAAMACNPWRPKRVAR